MKMLYMMLVLGVSSRHEINHPGGQSLRCEDGESKRELRVLTIQPLVFKPFWAHDVEDRFKAGDADGLVETYRKPKKPKGGVDSD